MEMERITQEFKKGFNKSSKIMEWKLGINEARLLSTLVYKYDYWFNRNELIIIDGEPSFWITIPNLQVETNLGEGVIKKCLKKMQKSGLIKIRKNGLPAKNHYILNKEAIENFDTKHLDEYEAWTQKVYELACKDRARFDNSQLPQETDGSLALLVPQLDQNDPTREVKITPLDRSISPVTNNKNTNNKQHKITTNRKNAVEDNFEGYDELENEVSCLIYGHGDEVDSHERLYSLLKSLVPSLNNFTESQEDAQLIDQIRSFNLDVATITFKILENARDIKRGKKKVRFGNLFVGLEAMNRNLVKKVS